MTPNTAVPSRPWLASLIILLFAGLLSFPGHALTQGDVDKALQHVYRAQVNAYYSINSFYNFSVNQADQAQLEQVNEAVAEVDQQLNELATMLTDGASKDTLKATQDLWTKYRKILDQNVKTVLKTGFIDLRLSGDMTLNNIALQDQLQILLNSLSAGAKTEEFRHICHKSAVTLALMMTKYSARTTSTVSQVYSGGESEVTIDALAKEVDDALRNLMRLGAARDSTRTTLDSAWSKWEFIRNSYMNYNENRVNFIVNLYSRKIISLIEEANASFN
jgi:hypothetical protein